MKYASKKQLIDRIEAEHAAFVELADSAPKAPWNETPRLNHDIWKKHERTSWKRIRADFDASYEEVLAFAKSLSERELLAPGAHAWTRKHPLTTYLGANTCSHYAAATKILKRWMKRHR